MAVWTGRLPHPGSVCVVRLCFEGASDRGVMKDGSKDGRTLPIEVLCSYGSRMLKDI